MKRTAMRWCAACMVAIVMIVAWETGFYMASITQERRQLSSRLGRVRGASSGNKEDLKTRVERVQAERRRIVHEECMRLHFSNKVTEYSVKHFIVIESHKLAYCFIPKVGCSNWKRIMMVLDNQTDSVDDLTSDEVHIQAKFKYLFSYSPEDQKRILSEYSKFLFVRHPFERILSVYKNKLEDLKTYRRNRLFHRFGREIVKRWRPGASEADLQTGENVTWSEFVQYLIHTERRDKVEKDFYASDHWREMYKVCSPCSIDYDFIGHLEDVGEESEYLLDKWGVKGSARYLGAETSRPTDSKSTYETYFTQISQLDLMKLWDIYRKDFILFDYTKPWFVPNP